MSKLQLDEALTELSRVDSTFFAEIRKRLAPVKDRFFAAPVRTSLDSQKDGLYTPPPYIAEPDLRKVAMELAEFALDRGIDVNSACEPDGTTFLHFCVLLRDSAIAVDTVGWLLAHGADPNLKRNDGETPMSLALKFGRTAVADLMRAHGGR
jgi:ankyrin repeat protein